MASFCSVIRRDSVSLLRFPFLGDIHVFSREISLGCRLKRQLNCFSFHFSFFCYFFLLMLVLSFIIIIIIIIIIICKNPAKLS